MERLIVAANRRWNLLLGAWLVAVLATGAALFLGEVMGMAPCQLCWFQRIFMFPLVLKQPVGAPGSEHVAQLLAAGFAMVPALTQNQLAELRQSCRRECLPEDYRFPVCGQP